MCFDASFHWTSGGSLLRESLYPRNQIPIRPSFDKACGAIPCCTVYTERTPVSKLRTVGLSKTVGTRHVVSRRSVFMTANCSPPARILAIRLKAPEGSGSTPRPASIPEQETLTTTQSILSKAVVQELGAGHGPCKESGENDGKLRNSTGVLLRTEAHTSR